MIGMMRTILSTVLVIVLAIGFGGTGDSEAFAQGSATSSSQSDSTALDYDAWDKTAARAESAIEVARASTPALEALRADLTQWRDKFQAAQGINASTISTVQRQLDA